MISPDEMNQSIQTIIIAPMTTKSRPYPTRIPVYFKDKNGWIVPGPDPYSRQKQVYKKNLEKSIKKKL